MIERGYRGGRDASEVGPPARLPSGSVPAGNPAIQPEALARLFHETYERLAPDFGYRTREASAKPWEQVPEQNRVLMVATCAEVLAALARQPAGQSCRDPECGCPASRLAARAALSTPPDTEETTP